MTEYEALLEVLHHENWEEELSSRSISIHWDGDCAGVLLLLIRQSGCEGQGLVYGVENCCNCCGG